VDGDGEAIALLLFTSGSTASPKPVMVPHRQLRYGSDTLIRDGVGNKSGALGLPRECKTRSSNVVLDDPIGHNVNHQCAGFAGSAGAVESDVVAAAVSLHWDVASYDLGLALTLPAAMLVLPEDAFDQPTELRQAMAEHSASVLFGTPSTLKRVLLLRSIPVEATATPSLHQLRYAISTGEPFSASLAAQCRATIPNLQVMDCYGATEFSNVVTRILPEAAASGQIQWDGLAFDRTTMRLRNPTADDGHPNGGTTGELVLSTAGLMRGYLTEMQQHIEQTNVSIHLPPPVREYATGDIVHVRRNREGEPTAVFDVIGRTDRQVHVDGVRHNLDALEALFEQSEVVVAAACLLWQDQTRIHVFVSLSSHVESWSDDKLVSVLSEHAREVVSALLPTDIHILSGDDTKNESKSGMPLTQTGKKDRKLLRARLPRLEAEMRLEAEGWWVWLHWICTQVLAVFNTVEAAIDQPGSSKLAWCPTASHEQASIVIS
jgi:acyl-coenzyme A synthetase/AMP-(fatty) acid ligase